MVTWYVKKLGKLTNVSVRTLHYYDKIGLLKPSARAANGYRVYSETDLINLEQIIALKFFGFTLVQIKMLLQRQIDTLKLLRAQLQLLQEKVTYLENTQKKLLLTTIQQLEADNSVNWHHIVELIQAYAQSQETKMTQTAHAFLEDHMKQEDALEKNATKKTILKKMHSAQKPPQQNEL